MAGVKSGIPAWVTLLKNSFPYDILFFLSHKDPLRDLVHRSSASAAYFIECGRTYCHTGRIGIRGRNFFHQKGFSTANARAFMSGATYVRFNYVVQDYMCSNARFAEYAAKRQQQKQKAAKCGFLQ